MLIGKPHWEAAPDLVGDPAGVGHDPAHLVGDPAGAVDDHASALAGDACTDASCWCCPPLPPFSAINYVCIESYCP